MEETLRLLRMTVRCGLFFHVLEILDRSGYGILAGGELRVLQAVFVLLQHLCFPFLFWKSLRFFSGHGW